MYALFRAESYRREGRPQGGHLGKGAGPSRCTRSRCCSVFTRGDREQLFEEPSVPAKRHSRDLDCHDNVRRAFVDDHRRGHAVVRMNMCGHDSPRRKAGLVELRLDET